MASNAVVLESDHPGGDSADFILDLAEVKRGAEAVARVREALKGAEARASGEALDTLALLITSGVCDAEEFPWQQVRTHHRAAVLTLLKESGTPALVEKLRCQRDSTHRFHQPAPAYTSAQVQKFRTALQRVLRECGQLGYLPSEESGAQKAGMSRVRVLTDGEYRALAFACDVDDSANGSRDALILYLGYHGGLRVSDLVRLTVDDVVYDKTRDQMTVVVRPSKGERKRKVPLGNEALIVLEDWLEQRGREDGPLLCPIRRGRIERRRISGDNVRDLLVKRAESAGVSPFSANDLRRRASATAATSRRSSKRRTAKSNGDALYSREDASSDGRAETLRFPYKSRAVQAP